MKFLLVCTGKKFRVHTSKKIPILPTWARVKSISSALGEGYRDLFCKITIFDVKTSNFLPINFKNSCIFNFLTLQ